VVEPFPTGVPAAAASGYDAATTPAGGFAELANERPEIAAGAAFAGGFLFALILKRLAS
jgi:hypothetical protein